MTLFETNWAAIFDSDLVDASQETYTHKRRDYNDTIDYEFMAKPKYSACFEVASEKLFAVLGVVRPNAAKKRAMEHLLFNLSIAYRDHPDSAVRHFRSRGFWPVNNAEKNPYRIGYKIIEIIDLLTKERYLDYLKGYLSPEGKGRASRMWPTQKLIDEIFTPNHLKDAPVQYHHKFELVRINTKEEDFYSASSNADTRVVRPL